MTDVRCLHGDPLCPCNDEGPEICHYVDYELASGVVTPAAPCRNPYCEICNRPDAA